jgi:LysR family transcriptional regulator, glycine cleavage system transcriptional activator
MRRSRLNTSVMSWLRCFEAAARARSFTQAASELCLTQGAISQQVRELEDRLGVPLFRRLPRQLVLTEEGEQLREVVTQSFDDLELALSRLQDRPADGPLALSCYSSFALLWLMPRIGAFYREHPEIDLRVSAEFHALEMATVLNEGIDAAIRYDPGEYRDLEATPLLDEYLLPVASPAFVQAHPRLRGPADLDGSMLLHDAIAWPGVAPDAEWRCWLSAVGIDASDLAHGRLFNLSQLAVAAALDGQGVAMGRVALVLDHLEAGQLVPLFGRAARSPAAYRLVHVAQPHTRVGVFAQWLRDECDSFRQRRDEALPALAELVR